MRVPVAVDRRDLHRRLRAVASSFRGALGILEDQLFTRTQTDGTSIDGICPLTCVGVAGFEPTTSSSRTKHATKLRHTPRRAEQIVAHRAWAGCAVSPGSAGH